MSHREPICGLDYKPCKGCGEDCEIEAFLHKNQETDYCPECRKKCEVCGDWIGACGGEHEEDQAA